MAIEYKHERVTWADGAWADVNVVHIHPNVLSFGDVFPAQPQSQVRDVAQLRYTKALHRTSNPSIFVWSGRSMLSSRVINRHVEPRTEDGEVLLAADALINYTLRTLVARDWLHYFNDEWLINVPAHEKRWIEYADIVTRLLAVQQERGHAYIIGSDLAACVPHLDIVGVGNHSGFVSEAVRANDYMLAFNTAFFLLESDDWFSHYSRLGDPFGLCIRDSVVLRPPLYSRGAIWRNESGWHTGIVGMDDVAFDLDGTHYAHLPVNPIHEEATAVYTRCYGVEHAGYVVGHTPHAPQRIEFAILDDRVVGYKEGGNLQIPQNGFVLSLSTINPAQLQQILENPRVTYYIPKLGKVEQAVQGVLTLIQNSDVILGEQTIEREQIWGSREIDGEYKIGVVPTDWNATKASVADYRAARTAIGIKADGNLVVVQIDGVNTDVATDRDSAGATLYELAEMLLQTGVVDAINLDGGGSSQLYVYGGMMSRPADRRGRPGITYERMVPSIGIVR